MVESIRSIQQDANTDPRLSSTGETPLLPLSRQYGRKRAQL